MTDLATPPQEHVHVPLRHPRLPTYASLLAAGIAIAAAALLGLTLGWGVPGIVVVAIILHLVGLTLWSRAVENARAATDRVVTSLVWVALLVALLPLASLLWKVVDNCKAQKSWSALIRCAHSAAISPRRTRPTMS